MPLRLLFAYIAIPINALIILRKPIWGIILLAVSYFVRPEIWGAPEFLRPIFIFTLATALSLMINKNTQKWKFPVNLTLFTLMFIMMVISTFNAVVSFDAAYSNDVFIFKLLVLFLLIVNLVDSLPRLNKVFWAMILGCAWLSKAALYHYFVEGEVRADPQGGQGGGGNVLGTYLTMTLPFLFYKAYQGKKWERVCALVAIPIWLLTIIAVSSRGAFLALIIVVILLFLLSKQKILILALICVATLFFMTQSTTFFWNRMSTIQNYEDDPSALYRLELWKAGIRMFRDYPITGVGPMNFPYLSPLYAGIKVTSDPGGGFMPHNIYIELLSETGIQGLLFYLLAIFVTIRRLHRTKKISLPHLANEESRQIVLFCNTFIIGITALLVKSFTGTTIRNDVIYWFLALSSVTMYLARDMKHIKA